MSARVVTSQSREVGSLKSTSSVKKGLGNYEPLAQNLQASAKNKISLPEPYPTYEHVDTCGNTFFQFILLALLKTLEVIGWETFLRWYFYLGLL